MSVVTLAQLTTSAQRFADLENSNFISASEWTDYVNFGLRQYWNKINQVLQDYNLVETYFQLVNGQTDYPLPNDFMYVRGFDMSQSQAFPPETPGQYWISIYPYDFKERERYNYPWFTAFGGMYGLRYRIMSTFVRFLPSPIPLNWMRLSYIPVSPTLVAPTDSLNGYNGFDEYAAAWAAYRALVKEESDTTGVEKVIAEWEKTIQTQAEDRNRDIGDKVSDISARGWIGLWG
jgi:hypothetical protein